VLRLLSLNIEGDNHLDAVVGLIQREDPDVACLQECFARDLPELERRTGRVGVHQPLVRFAPGSRLPRMAPKGDWGLAILTRQRPGSVLSAYYVGSPGEQPVHNGRMPSNANRAVLGVELGAFRVITTHFTWTAEGRPTAEQDRDLDRMLRVLEPFPEYVLCGDFNAPRGGPVFARLAERLTDNIPADVKTTIDHELHVRGTMPPYVVDGLFTTPEYTAGDVRVISGVSDHCAVLARISRNGSGH
jgi:endonuclease/exonuclease/phosphatase family metal-dependent hydrolase